MKKHIKILLMFVILISITSVSLAQTQMSVRRIINPGPTLHSLQSAGTTHCAGTPGPNVYLASSSTNTSCQLYQLISPTVSVPIGAPLAGSGVVNFGAQNDGTYFCIVTNTLTGCSDTMLNYVTITSMAIPTVNITSSAPTTGCGTVTTTLSTPYESGCTYQWQKNSVNIPFATATSYTATVTNTTEVYTCIATNSLGCSNSDFEVITANPLPTQFTVSTSTASFCEGGIGGSVDLSSSTNGINYQLMFGGTTPVGTPAAGTNVAMQWSGLMNGGVYTVVGTNSLTGCTSTMLGSAVLAMDPLPADAGTISGLTTVCQNATGTYYVGAIAGATSYTWSVPSGATIATGQGTPMVTVDFTGSLSGSISVFGMNACGAGQPSVFNVTVNSAPTLTVTSSAAAICANDDVTLIASGTPATYAWSGGYTGSTLVLTPATTTTYYVTATGSNTCTSTGSVLVTVNPLPVVTLVLDPVSACQSEYMVTLTGGSPAGGDYVGGCIAGGGVGNIVYPNSVPANGYYIYYEYTNPVTGCYNRTPDVVFTINEMPDVDFDPFYPGSVIPIDEPSFIVATGSPLGGVYDGPGFYQDGGFWRFSAALAGPGTHTATYTYTQPSTGCVGWKDRTYTVGTVGIEDVTTAANAVSMFPNPAESSITLSGIDITQITEIVIVDILGKVVYTTEADKMLTIDVSMYQPGTYFIRFVDRDGISVTRKFMKQ